MERQKASTLQRWLGVMAVTSACLLVSGCHDDLHVKVKSGGWVTGKWHDAVEGGARVFLGIPYAKPPLGNCASSRHNRQPDGMGIWMLPNSGLPVCRIRGHCRRPAS